MKCTSFTRFCFAAVYRNPTCYHQGIMRYSQQATYTKSSELPSLKPGTLRLYSMRFCPFAERSRLVLAHKGISYETVNVDLANKPDWFLERAPLGLVPVVEKDGQIVYESLLVNDWLEQNYQDTPKLCPDVNTAIQWNVFCTLYDKKFVRAFHKLIRNHGNENLKKQLADGLKWLDKTLGDKQFFAGNSVGMIDYNIWPWIERFFATGMNLSEHAPNVAAWVSRMEKLPAVAACQISEEKHTKFYSLYVNREKTCGIDYDFDLPTAKL